MKSSQGTALISILFILYPALDAALFITRQSPFLIPAMAALLFAGTAARRSIQMEELNRGEA